jgi:hypothetical protein
MRKNSYLETKPTARQLADTSSPGCPLLTTHKVGKEGTSEARPIENTSSGLETTVPVAVSSVDRGSYGPTLSP